MASKLNINEITELVIGSSFKIANTLGYGFVEKVYENSLTYELRKAGLIVEQQIPVKVFYEGIIVGEFIPDLIVDKRLLVELKAIRNLGDKEMIQCLNYLKATQLKICLLINFGTPKVEYKRIVNQF